MLPCNKRQTIVKRSEGLTILRCVNKKSGVNGQEVDEGICSRCPVRSVKHVKPCGKKLGAAPTLPGITPPNPVDISNFTEEEVRDMYVLSGLDPGAVGPAEKAPKKDSQDYPSYAMMLWSYKEALLKWNEAGRPVRSQEEVIHIESTHCNKPGAPCDWYDPKQKRCKGCGCRVTISSLAIINKLKMATEHCPKELF